MVSKTLRAAGVAGLLLLGWALLTHGDYDEPREGEPKQVG